MAAPFRIYLSGPMAGCTPEQMNGWRETVKDYFTSRPDLAVQCIDPCHRIWSPGMDRAAIVEGDKADILSSHLVLAYPWKPGAGTAMEVLYAQAVAGRPVWLVCQDLSRLSPWFSYHADRLFASWSECFEAIEASIRARR